MHYQLHQFLRAAWASEVSRESYKKTTATEEFFMIWPLCSDSLDRLSLAMSTWSSQGIFLKYITCTDGLKWGLRFLRHLVFISLVGLILKGVSLYPHVDDLQMGLFVLFRTWLTVWFLIFLHNEFLFVIQILWLDPQLLLSFLDLFLSWLQKSLFPVFPICLPFISLFLNSWMVLLIWNMMWWCIAATTTSTYGYTEHDTASLYSLCEAQHVKQAWTLWKH